MRHFSETIVRYHFDLPMAARHTISIQLNDSIIFSGGVGQNVLLFDLATGWNIASSETFLRIRACYVQISENEILKLGGSM